MAKKENKQTLTYVKGLPTPLEELNAIGFGINHPQDTNLKTKEQKLQKLASLQS